MQKKKRPAPLPNRRLKEQRQLKGWTQEELAEKVGASPVTVSRWESGFLPGLYYRRKLCKIFGKTPYELGFIQERIDNGSMRDDLRLLRERDLAAASATTLPNNPPVLPTPTNASGKSTSGLSLPLEAVREDKGREHPGNQAREQSPNLWPFTIPDEPYYFLPGRERNLTRLLTALQDAQGPLIIAIDGLGGLGKTSLAIELARRALRQGLFEGAVGDSAQQEFFTGGEIVQVHEAVLDFEHLLDSIARQLGRWELPTLKPEEKQAHLIRLMRQHRYLVLVDNLETAENATALVTRLRSLLGTSKAIVTSRKQVRHDFVQALSLQALAPEDSLAFLRADLQRYDGHPLLHAPQEKLAEIHEVTGGAPLAMKLVVAQARFLDLDLVLSQLRQAGSDLYTYIFRRSWGQLSPITQRVLIYVGRTVVTTAGWEELTSVGIAENEEQLLRAIDQLVAYSLLNVSSAPHQKRYGIHQLTRQFVNSELPKLWREQGLS